MDDRTLLAVCIADEAGNQIHDGKVAVGRVVMNRTRLKVQSDGTVEGTILRHMQFSGFWCDFVGGRYTIVAHTAEAVSARAEAKRVRYQAQPGLWSDCLLAADQAMGVAAYIGGPEFGKLTPDTVNYYAPDAVAHAPAWAVPDKRVCVIGAHHFYRI